MFKTFFYGAWIGGQTLYWFYFKLQTDSICDQFWEMWRKALTR